MPTTQAPVPRLDAPKQRRTVAVVVAAMTFLLLAPMLVVRSEPEAPAAATAPVAREPAPEQVLPIGYGG